MISPLNMTIVASYLLLRETPYSRSVRNSHIIVGLFRMETGYKKHQYIANGCGFRLGCNAVR